MAGNDLAPFVLENVKELESGEKKGSGAYGTVYRITVNGVTCIDKRLHDILVNPEVPRRQRELIREKFRTECVILSKLRHPHIVHFVGVRFGRNPGDLSLVMECLHTDLAKFLEENQEKGVVIPVPIKLSILLDVSYGLLYLHTLTPPIIHRDLSANNILLTADGLQAKIADLGVSKLLDLQTQTQIAQTKVPGSQNYMPPEALTENPEYGLKLDIFSFGHLTLYTATQEFPGVHEVPLTLAILEQGTIQIAKRRRAIDKMGGQQHCLHSLVMQCLQDKPEQRPNALKLNEGLKELCAKNPRRVAEVLQLSGEAEKMTKETDAEWRSMVDKLKEENRKLSQDVGALHQDKKYLEKSMEATKARNEEVELLSQELQAQVRKQEQEKEALQNEVQSARTEVAGLTKLNEGWIQEIDRVRTELEKVKFDGSSKLAELEGRNKELTKERDTLLKVLDKREKDLLKAKAEAEKKAKKDAKKGKKGAKIKQLGKSATFPKSFEALEGNIAEREQLYAELLNENDILREELEQCRKAHDELQALFKPGAKSLPLVQSHEASQSPLTSPVVDPPRASDPGQPPPLTDQPLPPPLPPKPRPTPPPISPGHSQLPPPHASSKPPYSQQIPQDLSHLSAAGVAPQARTYPQIPPAHHWAQSHPLPSQYSSQYGGAKVPHQKSIPKQHSVGSEFEQETLLCQVRQGDQVQSSVDAQSSYQQHLRSPPEGQYPTGQHTLSVPPPRVDPGIQKQLEVHESNERGRRLDQNLDYIIHALAETDVTEVGDESSCQLTMHHIPYDPNLTCPMCNKRFRIGEIQKYRAHVNKQCVGTQEVTDI